MAPEKAETGARLRKGHEPVAHSTEWTTGFPENGRNQAIAPKSRELVVHFKEWTTGYPGNGGILGF